MLVLFLSYLIRKSIFWQMNHTSFIPIHEKGSLHFLSANIRLYRCQLISKHSLSIMCIQNFHHFIGSVILNVTIYLPLLSCIKQLFIGFASQFQLLISCYLQSLKIICVKMLLKHLTAGEWFIHYLSIGHDWITSA